VLRLKRRLTDGAVLCTPFWTALSELPPDLSVTHTHVSLLKVGWRDSGEGERKKGGNPKIKPSIIVE